MSVMARRVVAAFAVEAWLLTACGSTARNAHDEKALCEDFEKDVERHWNKGTRKAVESRIGKLSGEHSVEESERVVTKMDAIARDWVMIQQSLCKDCLVYKVMPNHQYVAAANCFRWSLNGQRAFITALESGNQIAIENAHKTLIKIQDELKLCVDRAVLLPEPSSSAAAPPQTDAVATDAATEQLATSFVSRELGLKKEAEEAARKARKSAEASGDPKLKADALQTAAEIALDAARWDEAGKYYREAIVAYSSISDTFGMARSLAGLAELWTERAKFKQAFQALEEAMKLVQSGDAKSSRQPLNAILLNKRAETYLQVELNGEALSDAEEALRILTGYHKEGNHPDIAESLSLIGRVLRNLGRYDEAIEYFVRAELMNEALFGRNHPEVAKNLNSIANVFISYGRNDKAITFADAALEILKDSYGSSHPEVVAALSLKGQAYNNLNQAQEGRKYLSEALEVAKHVQDANHPMEGAVLTYLGDSFKAENDWDTALEYYQKSLDVWRTKHSDANPSTANIRSRIAMIYSNKGDHRKAAEIYLEAQRVLETIYGGDHPDVASGLANIGATLLNLEKYPEARDYLQGARAMYERLGDKTSATGPVVLQLGITWYYQNIPQKALPLFEEARGIFEKAGADPFNWIGSCDEWIAEAKKALEEVESAGTL